MLDKKLAIGIPMEGETTTGTKIEKVATMWMHYVDWNFEQQWQDYKNLAIAWGTSNRNNNGKKFAA